MKIENLIEETANYFRQKILTGDYEFIMCGEHTAKIVVDKKYTFLMWIVNSPKLNFNFYKYGHLQLEIDKDPLKLRTQKERMTGWRHLKPFVLKYRNGKLKTEKQAELKKLQEELESLN